MSHLLDQARQRRNAAIRRRIDLELAIKRQQVELDQAIQEEAQAELEVSLHQPLRISLHLLIQLVQGDLEVLCRYTHGHFRGYQVSGQPVEARQVKELLSRGMIAPSEGASRWLAVTDLGRRKAILIGVTGNEAVDA